MEARTNHMWEIDPRMRDRVPSSYTFGTQFEPAMHIPNRIRHASLKRLLGELHAGHERNNGQFTTKAKASLVQAILDAVLTIETTVTKVFDKDDPQDVNGLGSPDRDNILVLGEDGGRHPWSLSENQKRGEQARIAKGKRPRSVPKGRMCGKILKRGQRYYTCKTCTGEATNIICPDCFNASDHNGHEVSFVESKLFTIACCCGNTSGFRQQTGCTFHPPDPEAHSRPSPPLDKPLPEARHFEKWRAAGSNKQLPSHLQHIHDVFQILIDYVLLALTVSLPTQEYKLPETIEEFSTFYGIYSILSQATWNKGPWAVTVFSDERHSTMEVNKQCAHALGISEASAEVWTKETEEVGRKTAIVTSNRFTAFHTANMFQQIDMPVTIRHAYDVYMEEVVGVILVMLSDLCDSHLNGDPDIFSMLLATVLSQSRLVEDQIRVPPDIKFRASPYTRNQTLRPLKLDWLYILDSRLWKMAKIHMRQIYARIYTVNPGIQDLLVDRFARNYIRLTEMSLTEDRETDTLILTGLTAIILAHGHPLTVATGTRVRDPAEAPNRILHDLIAILQVWYTDKMENGRLRLPLADPDRLTPYNHDEFDRAIGSRSRRGGYLLNQTRYLLTHDEVAFAVKSDPVLFSRIVTMLSTFVGINTQSHALGSHVKYEADFSRAFTLMADISHVGKDLGNCFLRLKSSGSISESAPFDQIRQVMRRICADTQLETAVLNKAKYTLPVTHVLKGVLLPDSEVTTYDLQVWGIQAFSFHHYLHYILGELVKTFFTTPHSGPESLRDLFKRHIFDHTKLDQDLQMLLIIDQTLTTFAVIGHIRAGLWSRNGLSIRSQMTAYRDLSFRECANDLEFVLLQLALCTMEPLHFMTALIDRFGFASAFSGNGQVPDLAPEWAIKANETITVTELASILEDFVWLVISLVTDIESITDQSIDTRTRRAVIQSLAMGPLPLYDIQRRLPEQGLEKSDYLAMLTEVADYRDPVENTPGSFSLKQEFISQVNPLYRHYNRNERAAVHKMLKKELQRLDPQNPNVIIRPLPLEVPPTESGMPISALRKLLGGPAGQRIVHYLIGHCIQITMGRVQPEDAGAPSSTRASELLEATLWLAMLALENEPTYFAKASVNPESVGLKVADRPTSFMRVDTPNTLFENLELMQADSDGLYEAHVPSINYVAHLIANHAPSPITQAYYYRVRSRAAEKERAPAKVRAGPPVLSGAERQKQLMAEFAQKQVAFAAAMGEEDDDDEEDDDAMDEDTEDDPTKVSYGNCIVCQDPVTQTNPGGALALFQPSRMVRDWILEKDFYELALTTPSSLDTDPRQIQYSDDNGDQTSTTDVYPTVQNRFGAFTSACGHLMHDKCMTTYFDQTRSRHMSQVHRNQPENAARMEFLCPLCKSIGNFLLPLAEPAAQLPYPKAKIPGQGPPGLREKIRAVSGEMLMHVSDSAKIWEQHEDGGQLTAWYADFNFNIETLDRFYRKVTIRPVAEMVDHFRTIIRPLSEQSAAKYRSGRPKAAMYIPEDLIGYTVACNEVSLRCVPRVGSQSTVAEQLTSIQIGLIKNMINYLRLELDVWYGPTRNRSALRVALFTRFLPDYYRAPPLKQPLLLRDPLAIVIEAAALAPDLLHPIMVMSFFAEITRVIVSLSLFVRRSAGIWDNNRSQRLNDLIEDAQTCPEDAMSVFEGFRPAMANIIQNTGPYGVGDENVLRHVSDRVIAKLMYMCTLPILRRFAIVYYALTGTYPVTDLAIVKTTGNEYDRLLSVLGIPRPTETMLNQKSDIHPMIMKWVSLWVQHGRVITNLEWPGTYELMKLPRVMDDLVWKNETRRCDTCRSIPNYPAMCLYCGQFLCLAGDCCAEGEQGECNTHMRSCGTATGMFVDIRRWSLLLLYAGNGSYLPMPYSDEYGDSDHRRNIRLRLDPRRFEEVRRTIWLNHGIPHAIARKLEQLMDLGGWGCL